MASGSGAVPAATGTAAGFLDALRAVRSDAELAVVGKRLAPGGPAIGVRMKDLFDAAKAARRTPLEQVEALFADESHEARMGALCILDSRAEGRLATADDRHGYHEVYPRHLDRITTWDVVDRAAPSVVGGHLLGRSSAPPVDLGRARRRGQPVRGRRPPRRRHGPGGPQRRRHRARARAPRAVERSLDEHAARMPRAAVRTAADELDPDVRARYVGR